MAHKATVSTRKKVVKMLCDRVSMAKVSKALGISVNTLKKTYYKEIEEANELKGNKAVKSLVKVAKSHGAIDDDISDAVGISNPTLKKRYSIELQAGIQQMGKMAVDRLYHRVVNGVKEVETYYEVTAWDEKGAVKKKKATGIKVKEKECSERELRLLLNLCTTGMSQKDSDMIDIQRERSKHEEDSDSYNQDTPDYSKLSTEDLRSLKELLQKASK